LIIDTPEAYEPGTDLDLMERLLPVSGARVLELGCGRAQMTLAMVESLGAAEVVATEVDRIQHERNLQLGDLPRVRFKLAGAEATGEPARSFDVVVMLKSLHHVPVDLLDDALAEIRRVLRPGGLAYISEPVYAGSFNELLRMFHDEREVREAAFEALRRAVEGGRMELVSETFFEASNRFESWEAFEDQVLGATHTEHRLDPALHTLVKQAFLAQTTPGGAALFQVPCRVDLLRRPAD
jgi:ubiquinone/menaquinone biosynthesis C-methylase UbiE